MNGRVKLTSESVAQVWYNDGVEGVLSFMSISLAPDPLDGLQGSIRAFYDFWQSLPKTEHLPCLADLLDRMPPDLAPHMVIADVLGPTATKIRYFGTRLAEIAAFDPTGRAVGDIYAPDLRDSMHLLVWMATRRPAGYLLRRKIVGRGDFVNVHSSLGLPIEVPTSGVRAVVNLSHPGGPVNATTDDRALLVQEMKLERWVDIGAGVPG